MKSRASTGSQSEEAARTSKIAPLVAPPATVLTHATFYSMKKLFASKCWASVAVQRRLPHRSLSHRRERPRRSDLITFWRAAAKIESFHLGTFIITFLQKEKKSHRP